MAQVQVKGVRTKRYICVLWRDINTQLIGLPVLNVVQHVNILLHDAANMNRSGTLYEGLGHWLRAKI